MTSLVMLEIVMWVSIGTYIAVCTGVGCFVGRQDGRAGTGSALGFFLGVFGLLLLVLMEPTTPIRQVRNSERVFKKGTHA